MSELSLNWKKLSSKINKKPSQTRPSLAKSKTRGRQNVIKTTRVSKALLINVNSHYSASSQSSPSFKDKSSLASRDASSIQKMLWTRDNDFKAHVDAEVIVNSLDDKRLEPGKYLAMDCEFVGIGRDGEHNALARVSIVNFFGHVIMDEYVRPKARVTDFRTSISGVAPWHLKDATPFDDVQKKVSALIRDRILVGHAIANDLECLQLSHPRRMLRDTVSCSEYRKVAGGKSPSLRKLMQHFFKINIQDGEHSSVEDARATMLLFRRAKDDIERNMERRS